MEMTVDSGGSGSGISGLPGTYNFQEQNPVILTEKRERGPYHIKSMVGILFIFSLFPYCYLAPSWIQL